MKGSLGHLSEVWEANVKKLKKNKYYLKGWKAAKKGEDRKDNPYTIPEDVLELLRKRNMWERGWEDKAYSLDMRKKRKKEKHKSDVEIEDISNLVARHHHHKHRKGHGKHR